MSGPSWRAAQNIEDDWSDEDLDIDVCQHCGGYFSWTPYHSEAAERVGGFGWNPQRCLRCIEDECWIERVSDGSAEGGETEGLDPKDESAACEAGDAHE